MKTFRCSKCGRTDFVEVITDREKISAEYHCAFCGNYAVLGVPTRWGFVEVVKDTVEKIEPTECKPKLEIVKKEARMGKYGTCKFEGCTKKILAGGYCYRHYKEVNGHPYTGVFKNHKGGNIEVPEKGNQEPIPLIQLFLYPELLDKLTAAAKREYRTPELHAAYLIEKALNEKADDTYQPGSGRRGG
jgi:transcription elongation factor Elf1